MTGTILDQIIIRKKLEVEFLKREATIQRGAFFETRSLISNLKAAKDMAIISEFKRASPSKGVINLQLEPALQAKQYEEAGASGISVLTDEAGFKGTFADLETVRQVADIPILCKDFIIDNIQIDLARKSGADVILLIAAVLEKQALADLYAYSQSLGMECLVEIHDEVDLEKALSIEAPLIGVNNRNLKTFEVNIENTERLGPLVKDSGALLISESGMRSKSDVMRAAEAGANGILVGETFMRSLNLKQVFSDFRIPIGGGSL
jgi:indole-3-glycerol phosphate synthase